MDTSTDAGENACSRMLLAVHRAVRATIGLAIASALLAVNHESELLAQVVRVPDVVTCPRCTIELTRIASLGADPDSPVSAAPSSIARSKSGLYYFVDPRERLVMVFDSLGRKLRTIGRKGAGPGEYQSARIVLVAPDGGVHILDPLLGRHTILSSDEHFVSSTPLPGGLGLVSAALVPGGRIVTNHVLRDAQGVGFPLQEVDAQGVRVAVFGGETTFDATNTSPLFRWLRARANGDVWVTGLYRYKLQLFGRDRLVKKEIVREPNWFVPLPVRELPSSGRDGGMPTTEIRGIWEDADGLVWTVTNVPALGWRDHRDGARQERYNSVLEVLDPVRGTLVATRRVDPLIFYALGDGYVSSDRALDDGTPILDIWQVKLVRKP